MFTLGVRIAAVLGKSVRAVEIDDQVEACRRVFASGTRWTVVRGSSLEAPAIVGRLSASALSHA
ncbi:hypothetical protein RB200_41205 [Streptomyces sp. PmtG]